MKSLINAVAVFSILLALCTFAISKSAIHEIEALIWMLIAMLCFCSSAIIGALKTTQAQRVTR